MRCGVLCDTDGQVKHTWALVSDTVIVPVEDGDQVIEWEIDHGETLPQTQDKLDKIKAAVTEQDRIVLLRTHHDVQAHAESRGHHVTRQHVRIVTPSPEPIYYGAGKGLHHRMIGAEGNVQETPTHPTNTLETTSNGVNKT